MRWFFSNDAPIYTQLIEQIQVGIVTGVFPKGERLPSVRDLATEAGVNPNTMQRRWRSWRGTAWYTASGPRADL